MKSLSDCVAELTELIQQNRTIEAMERFYADDVTMPNAARQENETPPRTGKVACLEHERRMLSGVTTVQGRRTGQAINKPTGVVFSEWEYTFTDLSGQRFLLTEVSVQQWRNELISTEKFYYNKAIRLP